MVNNLEKSEKRNSKRYSFLIKLKKSDNYSKFFSFIIFMSILILSISSADTVQAEDIGNISNNSSSVDDNLNNSSDENSTITLNKSEIVHSGTTVAYYIEKNKKLPDTITTGGKIITINQYLYAITAFISGSDNVTLFDVSGQIYSVSRFSTSYTLSQYIDLAKRTNNYILSNDKIPSYVSSAHGNLDFYNMVYLYSKIARYYEINGKLPTSISLNSQIPSTARVMSSSYVDSRIKSLTAQLKSTRTSMSKLAATIKVTNNAITLKKLQDQFKSLQSRYNSIYSLLNQYKALKSSSWYVTPSLRKYLSTTKYCQITNGNIVYVAMNLRGKDAYETGKNIFNWVRDNIDYSFYYRTKYGATNTLKYRLGNCVDQAHLIVALARSSGLPARYVRGTCKFIKSGHTYSHVWAQIYIRGKGWVTADPTNYVNSFGVIRSWDPKRSVISGTLIQYSL